MRRTAKLLAVLAMATGGVAATGSPAAAASLDCYGDQRLTTNLYADVCLERSGVYVNGQQIKLQGHLWIENHSSVTATAIVKLKAGPTATSCILTVAPHSSRYCGTAVTYDFDPALDRTRAEITWVKSGASGIEVLYSPYG